MRSSPSPRMFASVRLRRHGKELLPGLVRAKEAARANQVQAEARFKAGMGTSVELADAEALLVSAEIQLAEGEFELAPRSRRFRSKHRRGPVSEIEPTMAPTNTSEEPPDTDSSASPPPNPEPPPEGVEPGQRRRPTYHPEPDPSRRATWRAFACRSARRWMVPIGIGLGRRGRPRGAPFHGRSRGGAYQQDRARFPAQARHRRVCKASVFRSTRSYVGTLQPWSEASVGPQLVSAYVDTVLVRPGAIVKRRDVLATLDCRNVSARVRRSRWRLAPIAAHQKALASEAARGARSARRRLRLTQRSRAKQTPEAPQRPRVCLPRSRSLAGVALEVNDCILRAPFDGRSPLA